ncbi:hypothetical protein [Chitinolyticbacter albus]|uniref:hypothetical protein n=1 Tax=Chitinolyticbacter albus TaxID=2961951 RepID=UPI00210E0F3C|nr:hypothetical protein [Chitinolyticbacter albus]
MAEERDRPVGHWLDLSTKAISLISLAIAAYAAYRALPLDQEIAELNRAAKEQERKTTEIDNALKLARADLERAESERRLTLELYKEVQAVLALDHKDPRREDAVRVLVESLADDPFRWKLLQALAVGASSQEVQRKAGSTASFYREESVVPAAPAAPAARPEAKTSAYAGYNIDLFHCERRAAAGKAEAASALTLRPKAGAGRWRIRLLPDEINLQPGYQVSGRLIRHNADETVAARQLADALAGQGLPVQLALIAYPTPHYLSIFFC